MNDLISRRKLIEDLRMIDTECIFDDKEDILEKALATVDIQPTIEAEPVVHGEWIMRVRSNSGYVASITCSACGYSHSRVTYNFCPECGADMRKGGANNV